jgi:hypothetical protein
VKENRLQPRRPVSARRFERPTFERFAAFVILTSASSAIVDFLLKSQAQISFGTGPELLRFFTVFYGTVQVISFLGQARADGVIRRFGMGGTINALPSGVGAVGLVALVFPVWPVITSLRGLDAVLRNSLFRSAYELLFVPMDAHLRNRAKTILDVVCDRAGEAAGSGIVQLRCCWRGVGQHELLTMRCCLPLLPLWVGQRFGTLYVGLVEDQLLRYPHAPHVSMVSEAGWTLLQVPSNAPRDSVRSARPAVSSDDCSSCGPPIELLGNCGRERSRASGRSRRTQHFGRIHVAQIVDLLAWDEVLAGGTNALEQMAPCTWEC